MESKDFKVAFSNVDSAVLQEGYTDSFRGAADCTGILN